MTTRATNRSHTASVAIVCLLVVTACAGSDSDDSVASQPIITTVSNESAPSAEATTSVLDTTTTSSLTTTTTGETTATSTFDPPSETTPQAPSTTVTSPDSDVEIRRAIADFDTALSTCLATLPTCDVEAATADLGGGFRQEMLELLEGLRAEGLIFTDTETRVTEITEIRIIPDEAAAIVSACVDDSSVEQVAETGDVVDDRRLTEQLRFRLQETDGVWRIVTAQQDAVERGEEASLCGS